LDKAYDRLPTLRSRELRNNATDAERVLWQQIRNRQLAGIRFNRQVPIGRFICDFVARSAKLVIELDGGQHAVRTDEDRRRTAFLQSRGYRVRRFWNEDVVSNLGGVVEVILSELSNSPSPTPSREREGSRP
jgi:very-short-patch-repair endonuclease